MEVKKLMENLVLHGLSLGISPSNAGAKNLHINKTIDIETKSIILWVAIYMNTNIIVIRLEKGYYTHIWFCDLEQA